MSFLQLYYTSCENGLSGFRGFQFNAVSPGVDARLMREVEQLTSYRRPQRVEPGAEPVNLCYSTDPVSGVAFAAQVVYAGTDPSGRPGNYFVHALATADPAQDLDGLRPIELWGSTSWSTAVAASTELPVLDGPPEPGGIDRMTVAAHLDAAPDGVRTAAHLLTATVAAMDGGSPVVVRSASTEENVLWIAAVGYLLEEAAARRMSFATYAGRPDRSQVHLCGTVPDPEADAVVVGRNSGVLVVDTLRTDGPDTEPHPAAVLLATVGPVRAGGMWARGRQLADGTERTLDDWEPVLAAVHLLGGDPPAPPRATLDAVAGWLVERVGGADPMSPARAGAVLRVVLERADELTAARLRALVDVAGASRDQDQVDVVEQNLLARACAVFVAGRMPDPVTDPVTERGRAAAGRHVPTLLENITGPSGVLDVLEWAGRAAVPLPVDLVRLYARDVLGPNVERLDGHRLLAVCAADAVATRAVVAGIAEHLSDGDGPRAVAVLGGEIGPLFVDANLSAFPRLHEFVLVDQAVKGDIPPVAAVAEISDLRGEGNDPLRDAGLLRTLWPGGSWTVDEARLLLPRLGAGRSPATDHLKPALLTPPADDRRLDDWLRLVTAVCGHPVRANLTAAEQERLESVQGLGDALGTAEQAARRREPRWFEDVDHRIEVLGQSFRPALRARFVSLVLRAPEPAPALHRCAEGAFKACLARMDATLGPDSHAHDLAVRLVLAGAALRGAPRYQRFVLDCLVPLLADWSSKDRRAVRHGLGKAHMPRPVHEVVTTAKPAPQEEPASTWRSKLSIGGSGNSRRLVRDYFEELIALEQADAKAQEQRGRR